MGDLGKPLGLFASHPSAPAAAPGPASPFATAASLLAPPATSSLVGRSPPLTPAPGPPLTPPPLAAEAEVGRVSEEGVERWGVMPLPPFVGMESRLGTLDMTLGV